MVIPPQARYRQVADLLRDRIRRGDYPPGSTLPSGPDIAREFDLHLATAQRAVALLNAEGVTRPDGRGRPVVQAWRAYAVRVTIPGREPAEHTVDAADPGQALVRVLSDMGGETAGASAEVRPVR